MTTTYVQGGGKDMIDGDGCTHFSDCDSEQDSPVDG